ncbi:MAG: NUDIX domain-containing protein [Clostridia bacterium]|nr:NUDIX domain-containing protein [Clostridia bacterium]
MKDIQLNDGNKRFNCRVNGICIKDNKIFLSKLKSDDYWTFVGGKVAFGESTDSAILREYEEEVGVRLQIDKMIALIENFFDLKGYSWHQYIFFYLLRDDNNALEFFEGEREIEDNKDAIYRWFDLTEISDVPIKPNCSREILRNISSKIQHYINREN